MTAMHLFRTVLVALSGPKTFTPGLFMQRRAIRGAVVSGDAPSPPTSKAWRRAFGVVFVDPSGWLNLAASLSKSALAQARDCAARTLQLLNAGTPEAFDSVFLARRRQAALCDYWLHVRVPQPAAAGGPSTPGTPGGGIGGGHSTDLLRDQPVWR